MARCQLWPAHDSLDNEQVACVCNGNTQSDANNDDDSVTKAVGICQDAKTFKRYASCVCAPNFRTRTHRNAADKKEKDDFRRGWHFAIENWFAQPASDHIDNTRISFQNGNGQVVSFFFFGSAPLMEKKSLPHFMHMMNAMLNTKPK